MKNTGLSYVPLTHDTLAKVLAARIENETPDEFITRLMKDRDNSQNVTATSSRGRSNPTRAYRVELLGEIHDAPSLGQAVAWAYNQLASLDSTFLRELSHKKGRIRRYVATSPTALYPGKPGLAQCAILEVTPGWYIPTNISFFDAERALRIACEVAGLSYYLDVRFYRIDTSASEEDLHLAVHTRQPALEPRLQVL